MNSVDVIQHIRISKTPLLYIILLFILYSNPLFFPVIFIYNADILNGQVTGK